MRRFKRLSQIEDCWAQGKDARVSPEIIKLRDELMLKELLLKEHRLKCAQSPMTEVETSFDDHPKKKKKKVSHNKDCQTSNIIKCDDTPVRTE